MPTGLRLSPASVDLDGFLAFVLAKGAVQETPRADSDEVMRFRIDRHIGVVARRKDGRLTFAGAARPMLDRMTESVRKATADLFTREQWFSLPMPLRVRWWNETDYGRLKPSDELLREIAQAIGGQP